MPTYDYQCQKCGHEFERVQRITEDPIKTCPECKSKKAKRLLSAPNFILKGGGWYADGYADAKKKSDSDASSKSESSDSSDSKSSDKSGDKTDTKKKTSTESKSSASSDSKSGSGKSGKSKKSAA